MAIKIPARNYLTFSELMERWRCTESDLRYAVISGGIKPSVRLVGVHETVEWELTPWGTWERKSEQDGGYVLSYQPVGWVYLQEPHQTGPFDCRFELASDERNPDKADDVTFASWYALKAPMTLESVIGQAVFLLKEIVDYEARHSHDEPPPREQKPLGARERDTLLTIIAALCKEAGIDYSKPAKAAGMIQSTAAKMGVSIGETTIEGHLKKIPDALGTRMK